jgi:hypothetical protein
MASLSTQYTVAGAVSLAGGGTATVSLADGGAASISLDAGDGGTTS